MSANQMYFKVLQPNQQRHSYTRLFEQIGLRKLELMNCFHQPPSPLLRRCISTGKYLSEALILASTNPQYDNRLFIELRVQYMKTTSLEHQENMRT